MVLTKLNLHYIRLLKLKLHLYWLIGLREKDFEIFFGLFKPTLWTQTTQGDHDLKKRESNLPGEASIPVSCFAGRTVFKKNILFSSIHVFYINVHPPPSLWPHPPPGVHALNNPEFTPSNEPSTQNLDFLTEWFLRRL